MYTIGQIEKLTDIKPHILRYWEEVVPGFSPQKDLGLIFRIKFLTTNLKMTAENAGKQILKEAQLVQKYPETFRNISETRLLLADIYFKLQK